MAWVRTNRIDGLELPAAGTSILSALVPESEAEYAHKFDHLADWCNATETSIAKVNPTSSPRRDGYKANTTNARGAIALYDDTTAKLRIALALWLPSEITAAAGEGQCGAAVLCPGERGGIAEANVRSIFAGLTYSGEGKEPKWALCPDSNAGLKTAEGATLPATSLISAEKLKVSTVTWMRVEVEGAKVTLYTPDGKLEQDFTSIKNEASKVLGPWYGVRCRQLSGVLANKTVSIDCMDFQAWDAAVPPVYSKWEDAYNAMANPQMLWSFSPGSSLHKTGGENPGFDALNRFDPFFQAFKVTFNSTTTQKYEWALPETLDLTGRDLALLYEFQAPDQLKYNKAITTAAEVSQASIEAGNFTIEATSEAPFTEAPKVGVPGVVVVKVGAEHLVISVASREGKKLKGCNLMLGSPAAIPGAAKLFQHNGADQDFTTTSVYLAESATAMGENKYWQFVVPGYAQGAPAITTWPTAVGNELGPEARQGAGGSADLTKVKYIKLQFSANATLPKSGAEYEGPQEEISTYEMKLGGLLTFDHVDKPTIVVSYDDSHVGTAQVGEIASSFGFRVSLFDIIDNIGEATHLSEAEWQALLGEGQEVDIHTRYHKNHGAPSVASFFAQGPWHHLGVVAPTVVPTEFSEGKAYLEGKGVLGPFAGAWAFGQGTTRAVTDALYDLDISVFRSTNGGGVGNSDYTTEGAGEAIKVTGADLSSVTCRMLTWPAGDRHRIPGEGFSTDIDEGDEQGYKLAIRAAYEAIKKGCIKVFYSHVLVADGGEPSGGAWTETMLETFFGAMADWRDGTNLFGFNGAEEEFPNLRVVGLAEAVTGEAQQVSASGREVWPFSRRNRIVNP